MQLLADLARDTRLLHASVAYSIVPEGGLTARQLQEASYINFVACVSS
jgi:hypothetical protein